MKPEEKAKQLFDKIDVQVFSQERGWQTEKEQTKEIALICIDEIIAEINEFDNTDGYAKSRIYYFQEVKTQITQM